jgi:hypothetical protein
MEELIREFKLIQRFCQEYCDNPPPDVDAHTVPEGCVSIEYITEDTIGFKATIDSGSVPMSKYLEWKTSMCTG